MQHAGLRDGWQEELGEILEAHMGDPEVVVPAGFFLLDRVRDHPPDEGWDRHGTAELVRDIARATREELGADASAERVPVLHFLEALALVEMGPAYDDEAVAAFERLPQDDAAALLEMARLHKLRGRFLHALETYRRLDVMPLEPAEKTRVLNNMALCAMGAGLGEAAVVALRRLGLDAHLRDDEPLVDGLPMVQVRVSTRGPLVSPWPGAESHPPDFDYVWVRPHSPCHGMVITPTLLNAGADAGDVILWDDVPIGHRTDERGTVPRFMHLAVLRPSNRRIFRFIGQQHHRGELAELQDELPTDCLVYVLTEQVRVICRDCLRGGAAVHPHHYEEPPGQAVVYGKLVMPKERDLAAFRLKWEELLREHKIEVACPALHQALGDFARAHVAEQEWERMEQSAE